MKQKIFYIALSILFNFVVASAQGQNRMQDLMKKGKQLVEAGDYEQANMTFRQILTLDQAIPSEFCYFFAKALYHTGQFQNSKNFINKYYELAENNGDYLEQVKQVEKLVDEELTDILQCSLCDDHGYRLQECHICDGSRNVVSVCNTCKGKGNIICTVCGGGGVLIRKNVFNNSEYHTCSQCQGSGIIPCPRCEGEKEISSSCPECRGTGTISSGIICNHVSPQESAEKSEK